MEDCLFCKIIKREEEADVVFEDENVIAFKNKYPVAEYHILIVLKDHVVSFARIEDLSVLASMGKVAQKFIEEYDLKGAYKLVFNGEKHFMVPHLHWHLLGGKLQDESDTLNKT